MRVLAEHPPESEDAVTSVLQTHRCFWQGCLFLLSVPCGWGFSNGEDSRVLATTGSFSLGTPSLAQVPAETARHMPGTPIQSVLLPRWSPASSRTGPAGAFSWSFCPAPALTPACTPQGRDSRARRAHGCPEAAQPGSRVGSHSGLEEVPLVAGTGSVQLVPSPPPPHFQPWAPVRYSCLPTTSPPCVPTATLRGLLYLCLKQLSLCQWTH